MNVCIYVCIYSAALNSQFPNCCSFSHLSNTSPYCFSLSFLLTSVHLRGESFWWQSFQTCCPRCLMPSQAQLCRDRGAAAAAAPAHSQCCSLGSRAVTLCWDHKAGRWQAQYPPCKEQGKKGGIQHIQIHTREKKKKHILTFWTFIQLPRSIGRCASCWGCKCKHRHGIHFTPTICTDIHVWGAKRYSRVTPFPEPHLQGLGSLPTAKGQKNWEPNSTPAHVQRPLSVGRAADVHLMAAVAANGLSTHWAALFNSAKFHS